VKKPFFILMIASFIINIACSEFLDLLGTKVLTSISVTQNPSKTAYNVNETFDPAGLEVTAFYSDGTSSAITGYSLSTPDMSSAGTKAITVTYDGKTASFNITVSAVAGVTLSSISVSQDPIKTIYNVNETFDPAGLEVTAFYSDGTSSVITGYSLSTPDMSGAGTKKITVTFGDKTASFSITVNSTSSGGTGDLEIIIY